MGYKGAVASPPLTEGESLKEVLLPHAKGGKRGQGKTAKGKGPLGPRRAPKGRNSHVFFYL